MSNLFWLTDAQMARVQPFIPKSRGKLRVDDRRVLSGIIFFASKGLRWCDALKEYSSLKTLYDRWKRWDEWGIFDRMIEGLASEAAVPMTEMIDTAYLKAYRTDIQSVVALWGNRRLTRPPDPSHQRRHELKLLAVTDAEGRPIRFFMTVGQFRG